MCVPLIMDLIIFTRPIHNICLTTDLQIILKILHKNKNKPLSFIINSCLWLVFGFDIFSFISIHIFPLLHYILFQSQDCKRNAKFLHSIPKSLQNSYTPLPTHITPSPSYKSSFNLTHTLTHIMHLRFWLLESHPRPNSYPFLTITHIKPSFFLV